MAQYPKEIKKGPLKGRIFNTKSEHDAARQEIREQAPKTERRKNTKSVTKDMCVSLVTLINLPVSFLYPEDALDEIESAALATSLHNLAKTNSYVNNALWNMLNVQGQSQVVLVGAGIIARRLARREIISPVAGVVAHGLLQMIASGESIELETRRTRAAGRANGQRENDVGSEPVAEPTVLHHVGD